VTDSRYTLAGRIVTMDAKGTVIEDGRLYVAAGTIVAVRPADEPAPDDFGDAPVVDSGGTMYPGLIELHNHLSYNILPLWQVPQRFVNRDQWAAREDYRVAVTGPMAVLGRTAGYIEAIVRYVEGKCLVGGTTTSQGITLSSNAGIRKRYRGIVRNVEESGDPDLPDASTHIADVAPGDAQAFLDQLENASTLLLHLSEGIGPTARRHFEALQIKRGQWAITPALAGIHCAGLNAANFQRLSKDGGAMIWSPFSNLLLYGKTASVAAARRARVVIALGSDWSPSGSKNLLTELKVAALMNENLPADVQMTARELVETVTINPARILKWDGAIGSLEAGKRADLLILDSQVGDPYEALLTARETTITLVVINGVPRYGTPALMEQFAPPTELLSVGGSLRALFLTEPTGDELVGHLTLAQAAATLADGLQRLPELAGDIERRGGPTGLARVAADAPEGEWTLELDQNQLDEFGPNAFFAEPLSLTLVPIDLDPLLVVEDSRYLERIRAQPNLPAKIRARLVQRFS
jgi:cytosine/adenosine deaminase-related metal-dependent hydrolase